MRSPVAQRVSSILLVIIALAVVAAICSKMAANAAGSDARNQGPSLPPEVKGIFDEMDQRFAGSKSRAVSIQTHMEVTSSKDTHRCNGTIKMALQFPNRLNIVGADIVEFTDPTTTTGWRKDEAWWGMLCDGKQLLVRKIFTMLQKAPTTLDELSDAYIEILNWGSSPMISCFLKSRPSDAFRPYIRSVRLVKRTADEIELDMITAPPRTLVERTSLPPSFTIVQNVKLHGKLLIPQSCHIDFTDLRREVARIRDKPEMAADKAVLDIAVVGVDLQADLGDPNLFVIPKELIKETEEETSPTIPRSLIRKNTSEK